MGSTQFKRYQLQPRIIQRKFEYDTLFSFLFDDSMKCLRGEIRNKYPNRDGFRGMLRVQFQYRNNTDAKQDRIFTLSCIYSRNTICIPKVMQKSRVFAPSGAHH